MSLDLTGIPACGVTCLVSSIGASTCGPTNQTCLCHDTTFNDVVTECLMASCKVMEVYMTKNITLTNCHLPHHDETYSLRIFEIVLLVLQTLFFSLRMAARALKIGAWGLDDYTIVVSWMLSSTYLLCLFCVEDYDLGGGDAWTIPPWKISQSFRIFYIAELIYIMCLGLTKISICFLFLRIFPSTKFRRFVYGTQIFNFLTVVTFFITCLFQCQPMSYTWNGWDGEHHGHCFNFKACAWVHSIINVALDIWMLLLPASEVYSLQMPWREKVGVYIMFGMGAHITITSIIRLKSLDSYTKSRNPTDDFYPLFIWTSLELVIAIIVACLPATRMVIVRYTPAVISSFWSSLMNRFSRSTRGSDNSKPTQPFAGATHTIGGTSFIDLGKNRSVGPGSSGGTSNRSRTIRSGGSGIELLGSCDDDLKDDQDTEAGAGDTDAAEYVREVGPGKTTSAVWVRQGDSV